MECWEQAAIAERELLDGAKPDLWNYNKALEALCFHSSFWPIVMELTNGKPKLKGNPTFGTFYLSFRWFLLHKKSSGRRAVHQRQPNDRHWERQRQQQLGGTSALREDRLRGK